jgi:hypothetical protein
MFSVIEPTRTNFDLPRCDDEEPIAKLHLGEYRVPTRELDGLQLLGQRDRRAGFDTPQQRRAGDHTVHVPLLNHYRIGVPTSAVLVGADSPVLRQTPLESAKPYRTKSPRERVIQISANCR